MRCPSCHYDNIPGVDLCESCGSDLAGHDLPEAGSGFRGKLLTSRIDQLEMAPPVLVPADAMVSQAIEAMREARHGCVLVQAGSKLTGIFSERDVLVRVLRKGLEPTAVRVDSVMTPDPLTLNPGDPPAFAIHLMVEEEVRHLPIVTGDELLGFISTRSILRFISEHVIGPG